MTTPPPPLRRFLAGLLPILLIALSVRTLGHRAGLPYPWHPDEPILMNEVVEMLQEDRLDPKFYHYPSLPFYLHMLGTSVWYLRQAKSPDMVRLDALRTEADTGIFRTISHPDLWAHERMVTALIGVLAVALTGLAARRLKDDRAGWIAALLLALSPHHVSLSRYVTVDVPTSAGVAAVLLASAFLLREGAARHYALAGIALGASITCKYTVVVGAVVPLAALLLQRRPRLWWSLALWIFAGIAMVTCQPWFLLKPSDVLTDMATEVNRYANLELGGRFEPAGRLDYLIQCARLLAAESFPGGLLLALLSPLLLLRPHDPAPSALRRDRDALILAAAMPVTFLLFISGNKVFYDRNLTTVEPGLAVLAALGAGWLLDAPRLSRAARPALAAALAALALYTASLAWARHTDPDSRVIMAEWLHTSAPAGMKLAVPAELRMEGLDGLDTVPVRIHQPNAWARSGATHVLGGPNLAISGLNKAGWTKEMGETGAAWFRARRPLHTEGRSAWVLDNFTIHPKIGLYALDAPATTGQDDAATSDAPSDAATSDAATSDLETTPPATHPPGWTVLPLARRDHATVSADGRLATLQAGDAVALLCAPREPGPIAATIRAQGLTGGRATVRLVDINSRPLPGAPPVVVRLKGDQEAAIAWPGPLPEAAAGARLCVESVAGEGSVSVIR